MLSTAVGWYGGGWIDGQLGTEPYVAWFGLLCGVIAGFRGLWYVGKLAKKMNGEEAASS